MAGDERTEKIEGQNSTGDVALRQYTAVLTYMQYEGSVFWTRAHHFLVANAALFGFVATQLPVSLSHITWARLYILGCAVGGGLALSILWLQAHRHGTFYIDRWQSILEGLEESAFGDLRVFRDRFPNGKPTRAREVARRTALLFLVLWALAIIYILSCVGAKAKGLELL